MVQQFTPVNPDEVARDRLSKLVQRSSVAEYNACFRSLMLRITNMSPEDALDHYQRGLKTPIRVQLALVRPADLLTAMQTAERVDTQLWRQRSRPQDQGPPQQHQYSPLPANGAVPMDLGGLRRQQQQQQPRGQQQQQQQWQQQRRTFTGACYRCGLRGHKANQCRAPAGKAVQHPLKTRERRREN
jgi:hypothetical protein